MRRGYPTKVPERDHIPSDLVGKGGFEPPASASRTLRANQAALLPVPSPMLTEPHRGCSEDRCDRRRQVGGTTALRRHLNAFNPSGSDTLPAEARVGVQLSTVYVENCTRRALAVERCTRRASGRGRRVHFSTPQGPAPPLPARDTGPPNAYLIPYPARTSAHAGLKPAAHPALPGPRSCRSTCSRPGWQSPPPVCAGGRGA